MNSPLQEAYDNTIAVEHHRLAKIADAPDGYCCPTCTPDAHTLIADSVHMYDELDAPEQPVASWRKYWPTPAHMLVGATVLAVFVGFLVMLP